MAKRMAQTSLLNLRRGAGLSDHYKDKRNLIRIIELALIESLTEVDIRKTLRVPHWVTIKENHRKRAAKVAAQRFWGAWIKALIAGAKEDLTPSTFRQVQREDGSIGMEFVPPGGVNFGGIMRIGQRRKESFSVVPYEENGVYTLAQLAKKQFKVYLPGMVYGAVYVVCPWHEGNAGAAARGWTLISYPWMENGDYPQYWVYGPLADSTKEVVLYTPWDGQPAGAMVTYRYYANTGAGVLRTWAEGTREPGGDTAYVWCYQGNNGVTRVRWEKVGGSSQVAKRIKALSMDTFWIELNGLNPKTLGDQRVFDSLPCGDWAMSLEDAVIDAEQWAAGLG